MSSQIGSLMANYRPRIILNQATFVQRSLIGGGEITVGVGTEVVPQDILGKSNQSSGYSSVRLAKILGVNPKEALKYLQKPLNSTIFKGELLAIKNGLFSKKIILAPTDGILEQYDELSGELRLRFLIKKVPLPSGVYGIIEQVDKQKGQLWIKTMATVVYGIVGFGYQRGGTLQFIGDPTTPIRSSQISPNFSQHILVGGALVFKDALKKAASLGVLGIVSGGINTADYRAMVGSLELSERLENDVGITILATEGFGPLPLGEDIMKLLKNYESKFIFINGSDHRIVLPNYSPDSLANLRKISLPAPEPKNLEQMDTRLGELGIGQRVRFISAPLLGMQGKIVGIDNTPTMLESGISTYMLTVETAHRKVKVPFPNIELIS